MKREELIKRLKGYEWNDIEFKEARRAVPTSAYDTVSAFSNTAGGWLVFGIKDRAGRFEIAGVLEVDKVQNDFLTGLRSGQRLNRVVTVGESLIEEDGNALLVFHVPDARREDKPIYLGRDIRKSFIRRGACDEQCTQAEIERFLRDAAQERYDGETVDLDIERCFHDESLRWYRKLFNDRNPGYDETLSHGEFLNHWGLVVEAGGRLTPTRAAILLFGAAPAFRQVLPRPAVDCRWNRGDWPEELADERWVDRLVIESNLVETWKMLVDRYFQQAEKPFSINAQTLQREDHPPDYIAFREAAINLLMHQDYADHTRKAAIQFFDDRVQLWNPGDAYASADELLEPGEREVRNPRIAAAFRRIGLSEQAGTGMRAIFRNWQRLGRVPPSINNDRSQKAFQLTLLKEELLSEGQLLFQASLGVHLDEAEANAFALVCREGILRLRDVRAVSGLSITNAQTVLNRLTVQGLISPIGDGEASMFGIAEHLKRRLGGTDQANEKVDSGQVGVVTGQVQPGHGSLSTVQAGSDPVDLSTAHAGLLTEVSIVQEKIIGHCDTPRRLAEIMGTLKIANRGYFKKRHLDPLLAGGVLRMTHPNQPRHPNQAYVLTEVGIELKRCRLRKPEHGSDSNGA